MKIKNIGVAAILLIAAGMVVTAAGYFWKAATIVNLEGKVQGVSVNIETIDVNLGTLEPGQFFVTEKYTVNVTHNCNYIGANIWLENPPYEAIEILYLSGNVTDRDTGLVVTYFNTNLMNGIVDIPEMPKNATINLCVYGNAGYPQEKFDLTNMHIKISVYPSFSRG